MLVKKDDEIIKKSLSMLRDLCDEPVLYINSRLAKNDFGEHTELAVTIANKKPFVDEQENVTKYPPDTTAVDLFSDTFITETKIALTKHWIHLICTILVFRGHEIYLDNVVYQPLV